MLDKLQVTTQRLPVNSLGIARRSFQNKRSAIAKVISRRAARTYSSARLQAFSLLTGYRFDSISRIYVGHGCGSVIQSCFRRALDHLMLGRVLKHRLPVARLPHSTWPVASDLPGGSPYSGYLPADRLNSVLLQAYPVGVR